MILFSYIFGTLVINLISFFLPVYEIIFLVVLCLVFYDHYLDDDIIFCYDHLRGLL